MRSVTSSSGTTRLGWMLVVGFHAEGGERGLDHHSPNERRVRDGTAHAGLVFDGERCVGWCQFGSPEELPRIKFAKVYGAVESRASRQADHMLLRRLGLPRAGRRGGNAARSARRDRSSRRRRR
jgi:hypothetical protein